MKNIISIKNSLLSVQKKANFYEGVFDNPWNRRLFVIANHLGSVGL